MATYFSASKIKWILENVPEARAKAEVQVFEEKCAKTVEKQVSRTTTKIACEAKAPYACTAKRKRRRRILHKTKGTTLTWSTAIIFVPRVKPKV